MPREGRHPNAYLVNFRNIESGVRVRTTILNILERGAADARLIASASSLRYEVVLHHLKLLESRGIVRKRGKRPFLWELTGLGQTRLQ